MDHRHLDIAPGEWGVAVVESIWERGSDQDVLSLLREVRSNPHGPASAAVRRALVCKKVATGLALSLSEQG
jgi:hypothetical protein